MTNLQIAFRRTPPQYTRIWTGKLLARPLLFFTIFIFSWAWPINFLCLKILVSTVCGQVHIMNGLRPPLQRPGHPTPWIPSLSFFPVLDWPSVTYSFILGQSGQKKERKEGRNLPLCGLTRVATSSWPHFHLLIFTVGTWCGQDVAYAQATIWKIP